MLLNAIKQFVKWESFSFSQRKKIKLFFFFCISCQRWSEKIIWINRREEMNGWYEIYKITIFLIYYWITFLCFDSICLFFFVSLRYCNIFYFSHPASTSNCVNSCVNVYRLHLGVQQLDVYYLHKNEKQENNNFNNIIWRK